MCSVGGFGGNTTDQGKEDSAVDAGDVLGAHRPRDAEGQHHGIACQAEEEQRHPNGVAHSTSAGQPQDAWQTDECCCVNRINKDHWNL